MQPTVLTLPAIAKEALALIDEEGLTAFSTRKLGARLGVEAMSLYHHVPSKHLLTRWVANHLRAQIAIPPADLGWRSWLGQAARNTRAVVLAHPNAFPILIEHKPDEDDPLHRRQRRVLEDTGLTSPEAARTARIVNAFIVGALDCEIAHPAEGAATFERGLIMLFDGIAKQIQRVR